MGYQLRREVRDALPPGLLTAGERLLVLELADQCNDDTREGWPGAEKLAVLADVPQAKVGEMFGRVAKKWIELRVPVGFGKDGRPYYSHPTHNTIFRFPSPRVLAQLKAPQIEGPSKPTQNGGPKAPQNREIRPPKLGGPFPQSFPQRTSSSSARSATLTYICDRLGLDDDDGSWLIREIKTRHHPRSIGAYLRGMSDRDLAELVGERYAALPVPAGLKLPRSEFTRSLVNAERCSHDVPGGHIPHPEDGWMPCGRARHASGWKEASAS